jgi:PIN domain nuclease of toxin-antitoxin system
VTDVVDASAILAFLQGESGAEAVEGILDGGCDCSAVSWSEVAQKVRAAGADWPIASALLSSYGVRVRDATADDAEHAAALWRRGSGLSLADRFCMALAQRLDAVAWTADTAWGEDDRIRQVR